MINKFFIITIISQILIYATIILFNSYVVLLLATSFIIWIIYIYFTTKLSRKSIIQFSNALTALKVNNKTINRTSLVDSLYSKIEDQVNSVILENASLKRRSEMDFNKLSELLGDISHQIKTPLTLLNIQNSILDKEYSGETKLEMTHTINQLNWLVDNLIRFSRVETDIIKLNMSETDFSNLVLNSLKMAKDLAEKKSIDIKLASMINKTVIVDFNWCKEAIFNILDNAIKYSEPGSEIILRVFKSDMYITLEVMDSGIGIDNSDVNSIYKRFYRGKNIGEISGVGIGLALAQKIMNKHSGYINCKSELLKGSTFSLYFPII